MTVRGRRKRAANNKRQRCVLVPNLADRNDQRGTKKASCGSPEG